MSLLPSQIIPASNPLGVVQEDGKTVMIDKNWWLFLYNLFLNSNAGTADPESFLLTQSLMLPDPPGKSSGGFTNPMTTEGDIIYASDNSGTPARLGIGSSGFLLSVSGGLPVWNAPSPATVITQYTTSTTITLPATYGAVTFWLIGAGGNGGDGNAASSTIATNAGAGGSSGASAIVSYPFGVLPSTLYLTLVPAVAYGFAPNLCTLDATSAYTAVRAATVIACLSGTSASKATAGPAPATTSLTGTLATQVSTGFSVLAGQAGGATEASSGAITYTPGAVFCGGTGGGSTLTSPTGINGVAYVSNFGYSGLAGGVGAVGTGNGGDGNAGVLRSTYWGLGGTGGGSAARSATPGVGGNGGAAVGFGCGGGGAGSGAENTANNAVSAGGTGGLGSGPCLIVLISS